MRLDPREASTRLQRYAKQHHAGAFATPTTKELVANPQTIRGNTDVCGVVKTLTRDSHRRTWTGDRLTIPAGAQVVTHIARVNGTDLPDWIAQADYVMAYVEDQELTDQLHQHGFDRTATRITASSEMIGVYGPAGSAWTEHPVDQQSLGSVPDWTVPDSERQQLLDELNAIDDWADDFPFYSDGTWDAVSLRGYDPSDPAWGVKPIEMGKRWHADNPGALDRVCDWTVLAHRTPTAVEIAERVCPGAQLERVRFLRMRARNDGKPSVLRRHSDITDATCGTKPGQMVRFFVPIVTHPDVTVTSWQLDGTLKHHHLDAWSLHYLDARKPHSVVNPSNVDRVHLTVDVIVDTNVRQLIESVQ